MHLSLRYLSATALLLLPTVLHADPLPPVAEASNMEIIGHSNLNGVGKGGEGLALHSTQMDSACSSLPMNRHRCASASSM